MFTNDCNDSGSTVPLAPVKSSEDLLEELNKQTKEQWLAMALASGWKKEFSKQKAHEAAFQSMFIGIESVSKAC